MTSPVETIADALIAFILSLLKDPDAVDEFAAAPAATLAHNGLQGVCMADVAAVRPVIIDNPRVIHNDTPPPPPPPTPGGGGDDHETVREIIRMVQQFTTTVDARSTIVDQSVNQNIWTEGGDVTQVFDQEAVVASGDHSIAAGDDVSVVDSDLDVSMGDVSIGNESNDGSFNQTGVDGTNDDAAAAEDASGDAAVDDTAGDAAPEDGATPAAESQAAVDSAADAATAAAQPAAPPPPPADVPEPADLLEGDMAAGGGDSYDADAAGAALDEQPVDVPLEDD